jgi:hypothetical protein
MEGKKEETMAITIGGYNFEGPFTSLDDSRDDSGVFAVVCDREGKKYLLDIGESATVREDIKNHKRMQSWIRDCPETLLYAVHYTPRLQQSGRVVIEGNIRTQYGLCAKDEPQKEYPVISE